MFFRIKLIIIRSHSVIWLKVYCKMINFKGYILNGI